MSMNEMIERARLLVGESAIEDRAIAPQEHAKGLDAAANQLRLLLTGSDVATIAEVYAKEDRCAVEAQGRFDRNAASARWAVVVAAALLAFIGPIAAFKEPGTGKFAWAAQLISALALGVASFFTLRLRNLDLLNDWMRARANAEAQRLVYFQHLTSSSSNRSGRLSGLLQLEYFRRYQLDLQLRYFDLRGARHKADGTRLLTLSAVATGVAACVAVLASTAELRWAAVAAAVSIVANAVAAAFAGSESSARNMRSAAQYKRTWGVLIALRGRLDAVRTELARGHREPFEALVAAVHDELASEHRLWQESSSVVRAELKRVDDEIASAAGKPDVPAKPDGAGDGAPGPRSDGDD
jgi:hypothetical protein